MPLFQRKEYPIPCPQHGHPGTLSYENRMAVTIYGNLGANFILMDVKEGKQTVRRAFLDIEKVKILTDAYGMDFLEMWWRLDLIHTEFMKAHV